MSRQSGEGRGAACYKSVLCLGTESDLAQCSSGVRRESVWPRGPEPEAVLGSLHSILGGGSPVGLGLCKDHSGSITENALKGLEWRRGRQGARQERLRPQLGGGV